MKAKNSIRKLISAALSLTIAVGAISAAAVSTYAES